MGNNQVHDLYFLLYTVLALQLSKLVVSDSGENGIDLGLFAIAQWYWSIAKNDTKSLFLRDSMYKILYL